MINYEILNSGSDGNAVVIEETILIDCGVSFKRLKDNYKKFKVVLLTHIHLDHFNKSTITRLSKERPTLRFVCCEWLVQALVECGVEKKNIDVLEINKSYSFGLFTIEPIEAIHDVPNCGYKIYLNNKKIIYITDTGNLDNIEAKNFDLYLIEGNYTEEEMQQRIEEKINKNEHVYEYRVIDTHLSQEQCNGFLIENASDNSIFEYMHIHKEVNNERK